MKVSLLSTPMRYFAAVAEAGAVSRAAERLHVAGSAVSRQIAALEAALGVALFERRQRGMHLTAAGERLAAHLGGVQADAARLLAEVRGLDLAQQRLVRIACTEGFVAGGFLPTVLARFRAAQPQALLQVAVVSADETLARLQREQADLALTYRVAPPRGCAVRHDGSAPLVALMRHDHPLARRRSVTVADVLGYPLLLNEPGATSRLLFDQACARRGLACEPAVVGSSLAVLLPMLRTQEVLMAGDLTAAHLVAQGDLVAVPFRRGELPPRRLQLLTLRGRTLPALAEACTRSLCEALRAAATGSVARQRPRSPGRTIGPSAPRAPSSTGPAP